MFHPRVELDGVLLTFGRGLTIVARASDAWGAEIEDDGGPSIPVVALTGRYGVTGADSRVVGALRRPVGIHELYRVLQQVLEETPRSVPRVPTTVVTSSSPSCVWALKAIRTWASG